MKLEHIHYSGEANEAFWHEELDDIGRYLRLAAEFGCAKEGEDCRRELEASLAHVKERFEKLVLAARDPDEPDDLPSILALRPAGPRRLQERFTGVIIAGNAVIQSFEDKVQI